MAQVLDDRTLDGGEIRKLMNNRNLGLWIAIGLILFWLLNFSAGMGPAESPEELAYSDFVELVEGGEVGQVTIQGERIDGILADKRDPFEFLDGMIIIVYQPQRGIIFNAGMPPHGLHSKCPVCIEPLCGIDNGFHKTLYHIRFVF